MKNRVKQKHRAGFRSSVVEEEEEEERHRPKTSSWAKQAAELHSGIFSPHSGTETEREGARLKTP